MLCLAIEVKTFIFSTNNEGFSIKEIFKSCFSFFCDRIIIKYLIIKYIANIKIDSFN